ncbi:hypothetical protein D3C81_1638660 [compost metagenome]
MRRHQLRTHRHRQCASQRATDDTAWQHTHRVTGSERDRPFGDEAQAQHQSRFAPFTLCVVEFTTRHQRSQTQRQRGNHPRRHNSRHRCIRLRTEQADTESIRRFVDRTAHVGTHHAAKNRPKQHCVRRSHSLQPVGQAFQNTGNRFTNQVNHCQPNHQAR